MVVVCKQKRTCASWNYQDNLVKVAKRDGLDGRPGFNQTSKSAVTLAEPSNALGLIPDVDVFVVLPLMPIEEHRKSVSSICCKRRLSPVWLLLICQTNQSRHKMSKF